MSEDLTGKLPKTDSEKLNLILTTTQNLEKRFDKLETKVEGIDSRLEKIELRVENIELRVEKIELRVENIELRVENIDSRLQVLEETVEHRLHDTRPIWHRVVADIAQLQVGQQRLEEGLHKLNSTVRDVSRDQIVINDSLRGIQLDLHTFDERLHGCEMNQRPPNSST